LSRRTERIVQRLSIKYNTNYDLIRELVELIGGDQTMQILEMKPKNLRPTARVNLTKVNREEAIRRLRSESIKAKPLDTVPEGIEITHGAKKIGSSLSYLTGEIMPQGLGSMLTIMALDPKPGEIILDMSAAPGGKSCFIGERMQGEGTLHVNDISTQRYPSLMYNLARHDISNTVFHNTDGKNITVRNLDKILLDAPCTGGGLLVSDPSRRNSRDLTDSIQLQRLQVQLLRHALSLLPSSGVCVYATCAISPLENEQVVETVAKDVDFITPQIMGEDAYLENQPIGKRMFPHLHRCDGFFIVKMVKK